MRLRESLEAEEVHTVDEVPIWAFLKDPTTKKLYVGTVNVVKDVNLRYLRYMGLERLPVRFGTVGGSFYCSGNRLISLEGAPHTVGGHLNCSNNQLTSLVGVHRILRRIGGMLFLNGNKIETGGIGLILVEGLTRIAADQPAFGIISKYLGQGNRGVLRCQEALHEAGFEEFAKL